MAGPEILGQIDGVDVQRITLTGAAGFHAKLLTYGARMAELWVPGRNGTLADVVLGCDSLASWSEDGRYMGATCGRYANRIANGRFALNGREVQLDCNEGRQHLHGGRAGLDVGHWQIVERSETHAVFVISSPDGDSGFPGTLTARVTYRIEGLRLAIVMEARTDASTVVNLVNHAYFNLAGHGSGDVLKHTMQVDADFYLPVDQTLIPTGEIRSVADTAFDFRQPRQIGAQMPGPGGFDHNLCLSMPTDATGLRPCLQAFDPDSGRSMRISTTEPGVQLYTGAHFAGMTGKAGARYQRFAGFAAETQRFPNTPNMPHFPSARLDPGQTYRHEMRLDFTPSSQD